MKRMMAYFVTRMQSDFSRNANDVCINYVYMVQGNKSQLLEELSPWALDQERS